MSNCSCEECQGACQSSPGWFLPGEAEKAAEHMGLSVEKFFDKYLGVNWWEGGEPIYLLAPAITSMEPGTEYPGNQQGTCIFFKEGKCEIHAVKPHECKEYLHTQTKDEVSIRNEYVAMAWKDHQKQITNLLGREPQAEAFTMIDYLCGFLRGPTF